METFDFNKNLGLPFHAFLMFLYHVAEEKFPQVSDLLSKMQLLMSYCDMSLRHYGVRSARLRRAEVDSKNNDRFIFIGMFLCDIGDEHLIRFEEIVRISIDETGFLPKRGTLLRRNLQTS